jgi:hypothetical protein
MSDVTENLARRRLFRNAVMVAVVVPAALLAGCVQPAPPPPPPQPQPVVYPVRPPPPPPPAVIRGERG